MALLGPTSVLRTSRTRRLGGDGQERSFVSNSNTKDDPSDPVHGPKRKSNGHHPEDLGRSLEAPSVEPCWAGPPYSVRASGAALANCESCNFSGFPDVRKTQHSFSEMFFGHCSDTLSTRGNTVATTRSCENYRKSLKQDS